MASKKINKTEQAAQHVVAALRQYDDDDSALNFLTVVKAFEVLIEYEWRALKQLVEAEGLEAASPKMAVRQAAKLSLLRDPEAWLDCIDARNNSVHDYFGITEKEYVALAKRLLALAKHRYTRK